MKSDVIDFTTLLPSIQAVMNNSANASTDVSPNEILYEFKVLEATDLLDNDVAKTKTEDGIPRTTVEKERAMLKKEAENAIAHAQAMSKIRYDPKHKPIDLETDQKVYIKLHRGYSQPGLKSRKYSKQRLRPVSILEKVGRLAYKLEIPET